MKYTDNIKYECELDISLINQTTRGKRIIKMAKSIIGDDGIWIIRTWGIRFSLRKLVDFLYRYGLDVFDLEYGSVTKIYICKIDSYRIQNSAVFALK